MHMETFSVKLCHFSSITKVYLSLFNSNKSFSDTNMKTNSRCYYQLNVALNYDTCIEEGYVHKCRNNAGSELRSGGMVKVVYPQVKSKYHC